MLYYLLLSVILSSPTELIDNAAKSLKEDDLLKAQQYLDSAKQMTLTELEDSKLSANQGYIYNEQNRLSEALLKFHESLRVLKASGEDSEVSRFMFTWVNSNIGNIYYYYSNYELAEKYYNEAMKHAIDAEKAELLYNKSFSQSSLGKTEEAINNLLEAFKLCLDQETNSMKANIQIRLGILLMKAKNYQSSIDYLSKVVAVDTLPSDILAKAYNNFAIASWKMGDYTTAQNHFEKTAQIGDSNWQFVALQNLSEMYLEQGYLSKCIEAGTQAEKQLADQINNPDNLMLYSYLSSAYEALGDYETALYYAKQFNAQMVDYYREQEVSIDVDEANRIQMITENYELKVQQMEERRITIMVNILISSIILITFFILIWRQQSKKKRMVEKIAEELLA